LVGFIIVKQGVNYVGSIYRAIWQIECDRNKHRLFVVGLDWRQKRQRTIK
jgi:hypothetical protein